VKSANQIDQIKVFWRNLVCVGIYKKIKGRLTFFWSFFGKALKVWF